MTINTRNPVWADAEHTMIDCEFNHKTYDWIPFTASSNDVELHGQELFAALSKGAVAEYAPPTSDQLAAVARSKRNKLLTETDWTQAADVPQATKDLWTPYRQALRKVPEQTGFPGNIVWPSAPG